MVDILESALSNNHKGDLATVRNDLASTMISSSNADRDFFKIKKNYEMQKAYEVSLSYRQSFKLPGVCCYLCQNGFFRATEKK